MPRSRSRSQAVVNRDGETESDARFRQIEAQLEKLVDLPAAVITLSNQMANFLQDQGFHNRGGQGRPSPPQGDRAYQAPTRLVKMEFPKFQCEDIESWILKCDSYFALDNTPEDRKITMASIQLDEMAYLWHSALMNGDTLLQKYPFTCAYFGLYMRLKSACRGGAGKGSTCAFKKRM